MFIVIILVTVSIAQALNPDGPIVVRDFVNCLCGLIKTNFVKPGVLIFPHSVNASSTVIRIRGDALMRIHDTQKYTVEVTSPENKALNYNNSKEKHEVQHMDPFKVMSIANYFVIIVDSYHDFVLMARKVLHSHFWNPNAKFLILLYRLNKNDNENRDEVVKILNYLFDYNVVNIVTITPRAQSVRNSIIYSWRPYDPPKYCGHYNESAKNRLLIENVCDRGILMHMDNVFKDKIPLDMLGCPIYILAIERPPFISRYNYDPNIEKKLISRILQQLNFSVNFEVIDLFRGEKNEEGLWDGALNELMNRKGHILLGGIFPDFDVHLDFECSSTYLADSYTWVVPRANRSPLWSSLTAAFDREVWYIATVIFFVCVFTWKTLAHLSGDTNYNRAFNHCFLNSWIILFGFPAYMRPSKECLRVFYVVLNMYCILFMTAYQTKLIDVLRNPTSGNQIKTIQDLVQSGLKYGGSGELHDLFYNSSDPFDFLIGENWIDVHDKSQALLDVVINRNFSVLCSRLELAHFTAMLPELTDSFGRNNYYAFEKDTFVVPLEIVGLRGFPFMKILSHTLHLYRQLGMNEEVRRHFADENKRNREKLLFSLKIRRNNISSLSVHHLQSGFFVLGLGMFVGTIILLIEIIFKFNFIELNLFRVLFGSRKKL